MEHPRRYAPDTFKKPKLDQEYKRNKTPSGKSVGEKYSHYIAHCEILEIDYFELKAVFCCCPHH